jgi:hypothetical protein
MTPNQSLPRRKFVASIEMRMRDNSKGAAQIEDLIELDMYTMAQPGTKPVVTVKEVTE